MDLILKLVRKMLFSILLVSILFPFCISIDTITTNETLSGNILLLSKENIFALGFFSPGNSLYKYLGIWYHKLPGKTVVWVANRENPIPKDNSSGVISINPDGNLVLYTSHEQKFPIWSTNVSTKETYICVAQLMDSGNLVLVQNESKSLVWQSFDYPTDTMLPGMKLGLDRKIGLNWFLTSWISPNDPGLGDTVFKINPTGSPQFFLYKGLNPYWRSSPWPWTTTYSVPPIPEDLYSYTFANTQDEIYYSYRVDDMSVTTRNVVDNSGIIQRLTWDNSSRQWKQSWYAPKYRYGHCGAYSICNTNNVETFECTCLPGYEPKSLKDWYLRDGSAGCVRKRQQTVASLCRNGEGFVKVERVKVPDTSIAAVMNTSMSREDCEQLCLRNCSCKAFASLGIERKGAACLMWYGELMDAIEETDGNDVYVRVDATELAENARKRSFLAKRRKFVILVLPVAFTILLFSVFTYLWVKKNAKVKKKGIKGLLSKLEAYDLVESRQPPENFNLRALSVATKNFIPENKLGQGGFGSVYKGQLPDGQEIAVKRLSLNSRQGIEEFKNEVLLIARLQHRNLVKLLGCCIEADEQMLIYEYMPNKSLDYFIFDNKRRLALDWRKRFDIIVGIARGMLYLHHDSRLRIIHRDLKLSNVLLDAELNPKISDFGMARIFKGDEAQDVTNRVVGTYGYMAPEYASFGKFSIKSDVFSFGVILLEIISGMKSNNSYEDPSLHLIGHVWKLWKEDRSMETVGAYLTESSISSEILRCIQIGLLCVEEDADFRPTMSSVVLMLNSEMTLPIPKQPAFIFRTRNDPSASPSGAGNSSVNELTITKVQPR